MIPVIWYSRTPSSAAGMFDTVFRSVLHEAWIQKIPPGEACFGSLSQPETTRSKICFAVPRATGSRSVR